MTEPNRADRRRNLADHDRIEALEYDVDELEAALDKHRTLVRNAFVALLGACVSFSTSAVVLLVSSHGGK
jgi:nitric oxide synthase oxygenase domain/subunit